MTDHHAPSTGLSGISSIESLVLEFLAKLIQQSSKTELQKGEIEDIGAFKNKIKLDLVSRSNRSSTNARSIVYPRKAACGSTRPFDSAQLFRILDLSHEALIVNEPLTKRELFYRDVGLFKSQRVVDQLVDDIAATFHLERREMNIRASSKGLVCGEGLTISLRRGYDVHVNASGGTLIPVIEDVNFYCVSEDISWVLVVEKEAVFNVLCQLDFINYAGLPGRGLLITGKGYPDMATRYLVNNLANSLPPSVPMLALVDGDPYGLDILSVYKYGSQSLKHENKRLAAERIEGLGIWTSDMRELGIDLGSMLPLTVRDEQKAFAMLRTKTIPNKWKHELMRMIYTRRKAEIEIILTIPRTSELGESAPLVQLDHSPFFTYLVERISRAICR